VQQRGQRAARRAAGRVGTGAIPVSTRAPCRAASPGACFARDVRGRSAGGRPRAPSRPQAAPVVSAAARWSAYGSGAPLATPLSSLAAKYSPTAAPTPRPPLAPAAHALGAGRGRARRRGRRGARAPERLVPDAQQAPRVLLGEQARHLSGRQAGRRHAVWPCARAAAAPGRGGRGGASRAGSGGAGPGRGRAARRPGGCARPAAARRWPCPRSRPAPRSRPTHAAAAAPAAPAAGRLRLRCGGRRGE